MTVAEMQNENAKCSADARSVNRWIFTIFCLVSETWSIKRNALLGPVSSEAKLKSGAILSSASFVHWSVPSKIQT